MALRNLKYTKKQYQAGFFLTFKTLLKSPAYYIVTFFQYRHYTFLAFVYPNGLTDNVMDIPLYVTNKPTQRCAKDGT